MSMTMAQVEEALMSLDRHEQASILQRGLRNLAPESDETPRIEVEAAWRNELNRRISDVRSGAVELLDLDKSHRHIREQLIARRK